MGDIKDFLSRIEKSGLEGGDKEDAGYFPASELPEGSILKQVGTDLTYLAARGRLKPVYHREPELESIVKILGRRESANPIIIGEPGVGKTVICHLLANRIVEGKVPRWLAGRKIVETSFERMYSTVRKLESDVTEQMKNLARVFRECREMPVILFMDEIHTICDFAHSLKMVLPALSDGSLRLVGATTFKEYRRFIEKNEALVRRMTQVVVEEPSVEVTGRIISDTVDGLESFYGVVISGENMSLAVSLGEKYIHNLYQPGKSIQLLEDASVNCAYQGNENVTRLDVLAAVSRRTGVPADILNEKGDLLAGLEDALNYRVLGQREITKAIAERIFLARMNVCLNPRRPKGVFMLAGPTGVGKTELAKALAVFLTGSEKNMVRLDMSIYHGAFAINSLLGLPDNSSGGNEARLPALTQALRDRPFTVLLLDEMEKAHPEVWKIFLSAFDEGRLCDLQGNEINFDHTTIVMTTNVGFAEKKATVGFIADESADQYESLKGEVVGSLEEVFPREFIARIDEILVFRPLGPEIIEGFVRQKIVILEDLVGKKIKLKTGVVDFLAKEGFSEKYGARFLEKAIEKHLSAPIARLKSSGSWPGFSEIIVNLDGTGQGLSAIGR